MISFWIKVLAGWLWIIAVPFCAFMAGFYRGKTAGLFEASRMLREHSK